MLLLDLYIENKDKLTIVFYFTTINSIYGFDLLMIK